MNLIGDVKGKVAVMVDDMIDTAGTEMTSVSKCYLEIVLSWKNILDIPLSVRCLIRLNILKIFQVLSGRRLYEYALFATKFTYSCVYFIRYNCKQCCPPTSGRCTRSVCLLHPCCFQVIISRGNISGQWCQWCQIWTNLWSDSSRNSNAG